MWMVGSQGHTWSDLQVRTERDVLPDLHDVADASVVQEALEVEDEHGRQRLDELLP